MVSNRKFRNYKIISIKTTGCSSHFLPSMFGLCLLGIIDITAYQLDYLTSFICTVTHTSKEISSWADWIMSYYHESICLFNESSNLTYAVINVCSINKTGSIVFHMFIMKINRMSTGIYWILLIFEEKSTTHRRFHIKSKIIKTKFEQ